MRIRKKKSRLLAAGAAAVLAGIILAGMTGDRISGGMMKVYAEEKMTEDVQKETEETILSELDMKEMDQILREVYPKEKGRFQEVVTAMLDGKKTISAELLADYVGDTLFYAVRSNRHTMLYLLLIMTTAAVFSNFSSVFQNRQIAEAGFYLVYILLITACLHTFQMTVDTVSETIRQLTVFMEALAPAYFFCMSIAAGSVSAIAFYNIVLLLIFIVELLVLNFILPMIHVYLMIRVLNFLSEEESLGKFSDLIQTVVGWSLKTLLAVVTGVSVVQGILSPAVDTVKRSTLTKGAEMIPGVGDAIGGVTEIILGTAVLVKNGVGIAGAVLAFGICLVPILNMGILTLLYKGMAAMMQPISDKRIVEAVSSVGEGYQMLLRVVFTAAVLFLITIAVAAAATS